MKTYVLGVKVDDISMDQALETVYEWLNKKEKYYIVTPNPEIVVMVQKDTELKEIISKADLAIPDGVGLKLSGKLNNTFAGVDFMEELVKRSIDWGVTVGFLGGRKGIAEKAADCLRKKYPGVKIIFAESGGEVDEEGNVINDLPSLPEADLLFVAFGPPKQEKWIAKNLKNLDVKVAMAVGGAFDYISGVVPRAPFWIRKAGFEWLFRLIVQPWRIKRQLALIKYLFMISLRIYDNK